jgi:hypothetical protein
VTGDGVTVNEEKNAIYFLQVDCKQFAWVVWNRVESETKLFILNRGG